MAASSERIAFDLRSNVSFPNLKSAENIIFFGNTLSIACQRCGAYDQTSRGHKYCTHIACPIALLESKRRNRKRTSNLEKVFIPRLARPADAPPAGSPGAPS